MSSTEFRVVEYNQNTFGKFLSNLLPEWLKPDMRTGGPVFLSGRLPNKDMAKKIVNRRINQLSLNGRRNERAIEIEELTKAL